MFIQIVKQIKKSSIQKNKNSLHDNQITLIKKLVDSYNKLGNINIRFPNKDPITLFNLTLSKLAILSSFNIPIKYLLKKVKRKKSSKHKSKHSQGKLLANCLPWLQCVGPTRPALVLLARVSYEQQCREQHVRTLTNFQYHWVSSHRMSIMSRC